ncbi:MAG: hypothetical protein LBC35_05405 [Coriobacteriales bacterium]|nr:hypothetical protein [Coriobacteriales bacterium]
MTIGKILLRVRKIPRAVLALALLPAAVIVIFGLMSSGIVDDGGLGYVLVDVALVAVLVMNVFIFVVVYFASQFKERKSAAARPFVTMFVSVALAGFLLSPLFVVSVYLNHLVNINVRTAVVGEVLSNNSGYNEGFEPYITTKVRKTTTTGVYAYKDSSCTSVFFMTRGHYYKGAFEDGRGYLYTETSLATSQPVIVVGGAAFRELYVLGDGWYYVEINDSTAREGQIGSLSESGLVGAYP